jgi:activator of 2-hydroxyglutaryl-CoA dehydratase
MRVVTVDALGDVKRGDDGDGWGMEVGSWLDEAARLLQVTPAQLALTSAEHAAPLESPLLAHTRGDVRAMLESGVHRQTVARAVLRGAGERIAWFLRRFSLEDDLVLAGGWGGSPLLREQLQIRLGRRLPEGGRPDLVCALGAALVAAQEGVRHACAAH